MGKLHLIGIFGFIFGCTMPAWGTTYTVTNTSNSGAGSLRQALLNATGAGDRIEFAIPGATPHTITVTSALPQIDDDNIVIDGSTQPLNGGDGNPRIIVNGGGTIGTGIFQSSTKDGAKIYGIQFQNFTNYGIDFSSNDLVVIGASGAGKRVVVRNIGNAAADAAIRIQGGTIKNTYVGVDSLGTTSASNTGYGIYCSGSGVVNIGGASSLDRCIVSNNSNHGIYIGGSSDGTSIKGAYIGVDKTGTVDFGNGGDGINGDGQAVDVGGTADGEGNVISGNTGDGIQFTDADGAEFYGNYIGTNAAGTAAIGNGGNGINLVGGSHTAPIIGAVTAGDGNNISGNAGVGIYSDSDLDDADIYNNRIGIGDGGEDLGNGSHGIHMDGSSNSGNDIGGTAAGQANIIAYNGGKGIVLASGITNDMNDWQRTAVWCNTGSPQIDLVSASNDGVLTPNITSATSTQVDGNGVDGSATVEVFMDDWLCGCGAYSYVATTTANGSGVWSAAGSFGGDVVAVARVASLGSSEISNCEPTGILPIKLLSFAAAQEQSKVRLDWVTGTETNNDYFTIERTVNGFDFDFIATQEGAGNSLKATVYQAYDEEPVEGISYYRLKQTDYDGTVSYSWLVAVNRPATDGNGDYFQVYPNPSSGSFFRLDLILHEVPASGDATVTLTDHLCRVIRENRVALYMDRLFYTFNPNGHLSAGLYTFSLRVDGKVFRKVVVVE